MTAVFSPCRRWRYRLERDVSALARSSPGAGPGRAVKRGGGVGLTFFEDPPPPDLLPPTRGAVAFVGLNPSTADETLDDPTIRRCKRFARDWGFGRLVMANAYAWRSTDPDGLWSVDDPAGPDNNAHLEAIARDVELVVCAWGVHAKPDRVAAVLAVLARAGRQPHALRTTKSGAPSHPLYLPASLTPVPWSPP